jgi:2-polyprenyl-3-methyl-5-hydroxy-6-metoxy-1,4-benzoquinol methylase
MRARCNGKELAHRLGNGHVLGIDRSKKVIAAAIAASAEQISLGLLSFRCVAIEDFELAKDEERFDLAVAIRVGALDGRHPQIFSAAIERIRSAVVSSGHLFIDGGDPLRVVSL